MKYLYDDCMEVVVVANRILLWPILHGQRKRCCVDVVGIEINHPLSGPTKDAALRLYQLFAYTDLVYDVPWAKYCMITLSLWRTFVFFLRMVSSSTLISILPCTIRSSSYIVDLSSSFSPLYLPLSFKRGIYSRY